MIALMALAFASPPDAEALDAFLRSHAESGTFVGAARVEAGGEVLLDATYGDVADRAVCRIGSVSKSFTAAALMALVGKGLVELDDPVQRYVPELRDRLDGEGPTLRHLLQHRGGLSEPMVNPWMAPPPDFQAYLAVVGPQVEVEAAPGARMRYSNFGYTLLARVVAVVGQGTYEEVLRREILDPLDLADTGLNPDEARLIRGRLASPLGLIDAQAALPRVIAYDYRWPYAGDGGLSSTTADLAAFARGLREPGLLSDEVRATMLTPHPDDPTALGFIRRDHHAWHNGALVPLGIYAYLRWSPDDDVVVALCGSPTITDVSVEWGPAAESVLAGEPSDLRVSASPFGWIAAASVLRLSWLVGLLGIGLAGAVGGRRSTRISAMVGGAGVSLLGLGLVGPWHGVVGAVLAIALGGGRWAVQRPTEWGRWGWNGLFAAVPILLAAGVLTVLLALMDGYVENIWSLGVGS
ncbi:MAG: hypothetical protein EA397_02535 [Deltaproteobacteria bacterium]|nr:MAG: hypothetical protein EA397_02535 [Deltaproteobacteria bacterium]